MAWIAEIGCEEAQGDLAEIYEKIRTPAGGIDHVLRVHSLNPRALRRHLGLYRDLVMRGTKQLGRSRREMIAVVVSATNGCCY